MAKDLKETGSYKRWETATSGAISKEFNELTAIKVVYLRKASIGPLRTTFTIDAGAAPAQRATRQALQAMAGTTTYTLIPDLRMYGIDTTSKAESDGLVEGLGELSKLVLEQLSEDLYNSILGRMRQLGLNRAGKFLSQGKDKKEYIRYARMPRYLQSSGAKALEGKTPYVSAFMNMGTRMTNDKTVVGAPHSPFVEYGFKDRAGRKHAPRPIFKLAKANMPAMVALAASKVEQQAINAVANAVNKRLVPANIRG